MAFPFEQPGMLTPPNQRRPMPGQPAPSFGPAMPPQRPGVPQQRPPMPQQRPPMFAGPGMLAPQQPGQPPQDGAMGMPPSGVPGQPNPLAAQQQQMGLPGMLAQAMPPGADFAQMFGQQQAQQNPFAAATPEEAAQERFNAARRAGTPPTSSGLFQPASPGQGASAAGTPPAQPGTGNVFAGGSTWFPGLFNTTNKTSPFDTFYVDRKRSDSML